MALGAAFAERQSAIVEPLTDGAAVWREYKRTHDDALREHLLLRYTPLVKYVVGRLAIHMPAVLDREDLINSGIVGLIEALDRYDPERGTQFESYAIARIKGAVIDQIRNQGLVSRRALQKARLLEEALAQMQAKLGRQPSDSELSAHVGIDVAGLRDYLAEVAPVVLSLDTVPVCEDGDALSLADTIPDEASPDPLLVVEDQEKVEALAEAIEALPSRERLVVSLYYNEGLTMKEVSQVMGVSESRVSQLHTQAILRLRAWLRRPIRRVSSVA